MSFIEVNIPFSNRAVVDDARHYNRISTKAWNWLVENFGETDNYDIKEECPWSWEYRNSKELTFLFKNKDDAMLFKLTWA